jgi:hypothetical protein
VADTATAMTTVADMAAMVAAIATTTEDTVAVMIADMMIAEVITPEQVLPYPQAYLTSGEQCFVSRGPQVTALTGFSRPR